MNNGLPRPVRDTARLIWNEPSRLYRNPPAHAHASEYRLRFAWDSTEPCLTGHRSSTLSTNLDPEQRLFSGPSSRTHHATTCATWYKSNACTGLFQTHVKESIREVPLTTATSPLRNSEFAFPSEPSLSTCFKPPHGSSSPVPETAQRTVECSDQDEISRPSHLTQSCMLLVTKALHCF